jgi:inositol-phosphate phosphatase/L-galactose 1-phosphate phosphatase/histidinol-phosphatase
MSLDYEKQFGAFFDELAEAARVIALKYFRKDLVVDDKEDKTPVTQADREIEQMLRAMIKKKFPSHGLIGEEYGEDDAKAEFVWVIDPIDGTKAFATGCPMFGTIVGLTHDGKPAVGMVDQAFIKERWFGVAGKFCRYNGAPTRVAKQRPLAAARLYSTTPEMFEGGYEANFDTLRRAVKWTRFGGDCYAYGLVALGWADLVVERKMKIPDIMGLVPLITGAGGYVCNYRGEAITLATDDTTIMASSERLAQDAREIMTRKKAA